MMTHLAESPPDSPASVLRLIHRRDDAFCALFEIEKSREGRRRCIGGIRARSLDRLLPKIESDLIGKPDRYVTVNGFLGGSKNNETDFARWLTNKKEFLRAINAVHVDIDCYQVGMTWRQTIAEIGDLADKGRIPQPSIFANSGRGCYVLWLIRDERDDFPPTAWDRNVCLTERLNREIVNRLDYLGADPRAADVCRILRVPGSIHSGVNEAVNYMMQVTASGSVPVYTLADLAQWFAVPIRIERQRKPFYPDRKKGSRAGYEAVARKRAKDLELLFERGEIKQGARRYALRIFALCLRTLRFDRETAKRELMRAAQRCVPAYPSSAKDQPPSDIVHEIYRLTPSEGFELSRLKHAIIVKRLKIPSELLPELETLITAEERAERMNGPSPASLRRAFRKVFFEELLAQDPKISSREAAAKATARGFSCNHSTAAMILKDLRACKDVQIAPLHGSLLSD